MPTKTIRKFEGFCWVGIGIVICFFAWKIDLGSFQEPGAGFMAFVSGLFLTIVGFTMVLSRTLSKSSLGDGPDPGAAFRGISWSRLGYMMALLIAYAVFLNTLGYLLTTFLVMWGLFYDRKTKRWASSLLSSLVAVGVTYLVFEVWLRSQLPRGIFPWW